MQSSNESAKAFARRLTAAMSQNGRTSNGRLGVDVAGLAKAAGTSYEMARRYVEGIAIPRPDKIEAIARWLGVEPASLAWGVNETEINLEHLERCLKEIAEAQQRTGRQISNEQAARLVALLYQETAAGRHLVPATIDLLLKV
jgi:transcriptional regulator with XRE-family HTH domain